MYLVSAALATTNTVGASTGDFVTGGKNAVINLTGIGTDGHKITVSAGAATGGSLVFLTRNAISAANAGGAVVSGTEPKCANFDYAIGGAGFEAGDAILVATVAGTSFFILTNVGSAFTAEVEVQTHAE